MKSRTLLAFLLIGCLLIPSVGSPVGNLTIPNTIASQSGPNLAASLLDQNWSTIASYVNARELTIGTLGARPAASTSGRLFVASDVNGGTLYFDTGSAWTQIAPGVTSGLAETFTGLTLSNAGSNASTTIGIAVGAASSDDAAITSRVLISLASAFTKTTAAWSAGTGNGCLDAGAVAASTWYSVFVIYRSDTTVTDVLCSTSSTAPTMPASYTNKRRIGSVLTDGSKAINYFVQYGDEFYWATVPVLNVNVVNPGTAAATRTLTVPTGVQVCAIVHVQWIGRTSAASVYLSSLDVADQAPSITASPLGTQIQPLASGGPALGVQAGAGTITLSQIRSRASASGGSDTLNIATIGWLDRRGRG